MAPTLIASSQFHKDISEFGHKGQTRFVRCGFMLVQRSLFKLTELKLIDSANEVHTYITIERVGVKSEDDLSELILDSEEDGCPEEKIIEIALGSGLLDETQNLQIGRIALRTYSYSVDGNDFEAPQVAGVGIDVKFRKVGVASRAYLFLMNWYEHLVCDQEQTIAGAKIWALTLIRGSEVRIYNGASQRFENDILGELGKGKNTDFLPWNRGMLYEWDLSEWKPNLVQTVEMQKFIVLFISRNTSLKIGYCPKI